MKIIPLIKDWIKITTIEILPIVFEAFKKLTIDLIDTYKEENFEQLALLREEAKKKERGNSKKCLVQQLQEIDKQKTLAMYHK